MLLRGRDAGLFTPARSAPPYHPSVGYARDVYVAIAMNAIVDWLGFMVLFRSYLATVEPRWLAWVVSCGLAGVFAVAFGTFATSLVKKPLRTPRLRPRALAVAGACAGIGALLAAAGAGPGLFAGPLALGAGIALIASFGFQDGAMVLTRALAMLGVGYLVAGPLHEAMFRKEIDRAFRDRAVAAVAADQASQRAASDEIRAEALGACLRARGYPPSPEAAEVCAGPRADRSRAELLVQTIAFVEDQERSGADAAASNAFLVDEAKRLGATAVVSLLGAGGSGRAGPGPRYRQAVAQRDQARTDAEAAIRADEACAEAATACTQAAEADPRLAVIERRLAELDRQADALRAGTEVPGAIERALALDAIVADVEPETPVSGIAAARGDLRGVIGQRAAVLDGKLLAAWFLALVMPALVLVMKISAGSKLEPYLRRRWAGRSPGPAAVAR